jgi:hypothetical protein
VTRHARLMHTHAVDQLVHRTLVVAHCIENPPPCRFGNHVEDLEHPLRVRLSIYMCQQIYATAKQDGVYGGS